MGNNEKICELFFEQKKEPIEVASILGVSNRYVYKILNECKEKYLEEKSLRSHVRSEERKTNKRNSIREKRGNIVDNDFYDISGQELREQHECDVRMMSKGKKMSAMSAAFSCINAYDVQGNNLVYNNRCGKRPHDLQRTVNLNIYK